MKNYMLNMTKYYIAYIELQVKVVVLCGQVLWSPHELYASGQNHIVQKETGVGGAFLYGTVIVSK